MPAYQIYALFGLDTITFSIVAANKLVYKITPPNLVATMAGVTNAIQFGVSKYIELSLLLMFLY